jgi:hypothetical protein
MKWKFTMADENKNVSFLYMNDLFKMTYFSQEMFEGLLITLIGRDKTEASLVRLHNLP